MAKFASIFISPHHLRLLGIAVWAICFVACVSALVVFGHHRLEKAIESDLLAGLEPFQRLSGHVDSTFAAMRDELTAEPCGAEYFDQLRKVAYLPDGLNKFYHAPGGIIQCAVNERVFAPGLDLGPPDMVAGHTPTSLWIDRDLGFAGLPGETGTIALRDPFALVIPPQAVALKLPDWASVEGVLVAPDGRWWRRGGDAGVHQRALIAREAGGWLPLVGAGRYWTRCDLAGFYCVTLEAGLGALLKEKAGFLAIAVLLGGLLANAARRAVLRAVRHYWTFEARFRRHLDLDSIVCAYQPLLDLRTGEIVGCEVLARWRDLDDRIVFPDRFIPVVERSGLTRRLTRLVVRRAFRDLAPSVPDGRRMQVNFNIFPRDLDAALLIDIFDPFIKARDRFDVVLEIVETDALASHCAQVAIDSLRKAGVKVYIDDFGTGYSNLQTLADLTVDGVKLDRCFAMAPIDSLMCAMLTHAVDMVRSAGRVIVVEGVESAERLARLMADSRRIDFAQGYHISRPLDREAFLAFTLGHAAAAPASKAA